ncbi:MAG: nucleotide exchange factor GrpE [Tenericutes bacterium]|nr:nucleotide exchange factor GrpE [Mycoplasmatota bacterium]
MKKTKKEKIIKEEIKEENTCNYNDNCDCGCEEGLECTCEQETTCGSSCDSCSGCSGIDSDTIVSILTAKTEELEEKYIRLQAEYLNFKTRTQSEISKMLMYEGEDFVKEILIIKDNLERAVMMDDNDLSDEVSKFLSGFKMILGNLNSIFDKMEVREVEVLGLEFDPHVAEAVLTEHDENKPENVVLEVLTKGYKYKDKLIRPAMVKVNK